MKLAISRVILFVRDVETSAAFYRDVFGLEPLDRPAEPGWIELDAGACTLALHRKRSPRKPPSGSGRTPEPVLNSSPKIVFAAADVPATRTILLQRGVPYALRLGKIVGSGPLQFCDGADPDGNPFQISSRV